MATIEEWKARFVADPADAWRAAKALPKMVGPWSGRSGREPFDRGEFQSRRSPEDYQIAFIFRDQHGWWGDVDCRVSHEGGASFQTEDEAKQYVDTHLRLLGWILVDAP